MKAVVVTDLRAGAKRKCWFAQPTPQQNAASASLPLGATIAAVRTPEQLGSGFRTAAPPQI